MAVALHPLPASVEEVRSPEQFTYPFCYEPHPLCVAAADEVRQYLSLRPEWHEELQKGKMFGVLVVEGNRFLAAFSGTLDGKTQHEYFVPPVFDLMAPGCHFQEEEAAISSINKQIDIIPLQPSPLRTQMEEELAAFKMQMQQSKVERDALRKSISLDEMGEIEQSLIRQSQFQKAEYRRLKQSWEQRVYADEAPLREQQKQVERLQKERHDRSVTLQQWLFRQFVFLNALGETKSLPDLFHPDTPPVPGNAVRRDFFRPLIRKDCARFVWPSFGWGLLLLKK